MTGSDSALTGLWFDGQKYFAACSEDRRETADLPVFEDTVRWLDIYFSGGNPGFTPPLDVRETAFRRKVYGILMTIPYGAVATYGQIADRMAVPGGRGTSARAVGGAVGHNPISLIIPCHRVVGADGSLTGYAAGLDRKIKLLKLEGSFASGSLVSVLF